MTGWAVHRLLAAEAEAEAEPQPPLLRAARFGAVTLLLAQAWLLRLPLVWRDRPDLRPTDSDKSFQSCNAPGGLPILDRLPPGLVLAPINLGANLLLHTRHAILAAPYYRNVAGLLAGIEGFGGTEADLKRHVDAMAVDSVVVCPAWLPPPDKARPFALALVEGVEVPWLEPIPVKGAAFSVWRVRRVSRRGGCRASGGAPLHVSVDSFKL